MSLSEKKLHILVIEHDPDDFILMETYLKEEIARPVIHKVITFTEAVEILNSGSRFDIILLNPTMPDASGEMLVREIVKVAGTTPIILLSGDIDKAFMVDLLSLGISDYLLKNSLTSTQLFKSIVYSIERNRISLRLKDSEENYRNLFNSIPIPTWVYEVETYKFLHVNEAAINHYGYSREEFLKMTIKDIRPAEDIQIIENLVKHRKKRTSSFGNYRHNKKNGEIFWADIQSSLIVFNGVKGRLVIAVDISERIKYTEAIEEQNKLLREIAWIQSHKVRAPLARMLGLIDILRRKVPLKEKNDEIVPRILNTAHELDAIIKDVVKKTYIVERLDKED
ncbi:MAG: PAS domain S-box protein [Fulvivirga sp.]